MNSLAVSAPPLPPLPTTNDAFLSGVFGPLTASDARPWVTGFPGRPKDARKEWSGWQWVHGCAPPPAMGNCYWTLATFPPGALKRRGVDCIAAHGLMVDDVGTKGRPLQELCALLAPSIVVETSPGSFQVTFLFDAPCTDRGAVTALWDAAVHAGLGDPSARGPHARYMRLPFATNGKSTPPTACNLHTWAPGRRYALARIAEALGLDLQAVKARRAKGATAARAEWDAMSAEEQARTADDLRSALESLSSDEWGPWSRYGLALKSAGAAGRELWEDFSRASDNFDEDGIAEWDAFDPIEITWKTVFFDAQAAGWKNPRHPANLDGSKIGFGQGELGKLPPGASPVPLQAQPVAALPEQPPFRRVHLADLATRHIPPHRHFLGPYLPAGEVTLLTGHGGAGKSTLALCIACALATGTAFLGVPAAPAVRVLVFSAEDPAEVLARRVQRLCLHLGLDPAALDANLTVLDATGGDPSLFEEDCCRRPKTEPLFGLMPTQN